MEQWHELLWQILLFMSVAELGCHNSTCLTKPWIAHILLFLLWSLHRRKTRELMSCASDFNWSNPPQSDSDFSSRIYYGRRTFVYHLAWHSRWLDFEVTRFGWRYDDTGEWQLDFLSEAQWCRCDAKERWDVAHLWQCACPSVYTSWILHILELIIQNIAAHCGANSFALTDNYLNIWAISGGGNISIEQIQLCKT